MKTQETIFSETAQQAMPAVKRVTRLMLSLTATATLLTLGAAHVEAATLVNWTFETSQPAGTGLTSSSYLPEINNTAVATNLASCMPGGGATATFSSPSGNGSAHAFSANNWGTNGYFQFTVNTVGNMGLNVSFDQGGSGTGPRDFALYYSTTGTGGTFSLAPNTAYQNPATAFSPTTPSATLSHSFDLSALTALEDNANTVFRVVETDMVSIGGGTVASGGTDRIDNFMVTGTAIAPVPEPATVFGGILLLGAAFWNQRGRLRGLLSGGLLACRKS